MQVKSFYLVETIITLFILLTWMLLKYYKDLGMRNGFHVWSWCLCATCCAFHSWMFIVIGSPVYFQLYGYHGVFFYLKKKQCLNLFFIFCFWTSYCCHCLHPLFGSHITKLPFPENSTYKKSPSSICFFWPQIYCCDRDDQFLSRW